jgi:hypothetical protein
VGKSNEAMELMIGVEKLVAQLFIEGKRCFILRQFVKIWGGGTMG